MQDSQKGRIVGVNGNILTVEFPENVTQNEVAYAIAGDVRLKCEVIRVRNNRADMITAQLSQSKPNFALV